MKSSLLPKPVYGSPCNSCGLCCLREQCPLSEAMFGPRPVCPALERGEGPALRCGLVADPDRYTQGARWSKDVRGEAFAILVGAGGGCDAQAASDSHLTDAQVAAIRARLHASAAASLRTASAGALALIRFLQGSRP